MNENCVKLQKNCSVRELFQEFGKQFQWYCTIKIQFDNHLLSFQSMLESLLADKSKNSDKFKASSRLGNMSKLVCPVIHMQDKKFPRSVV